MAHLSGGTLTRILLAAFPGAAAIDTEHAPKPILLSVPELGAVRIYLWTITPDKSARGRPEGEHKCQIIIPQLGRGARQHFILDDTPTFLLGFSPVFGVFVLWQVELHQDAAYSKNLQVTEDLLQDAASLGWAIADPRRTDRGPEVRCAVHPIHLARLLASSLRADVRGLQGDQRQAYLEASAPEIEGSRLDEAILAGVPVSIDDIENKRGHVLQRRLKRDHRFSATVLPLYSYSCAICEMQLNTVEAAHIIPVHDARSVDESWNGLSLCRNHHRLYDQRIIVIDETATIRSNPETLAILRDVGRGNGIRAWIERFTNKPLAVLPRGFRSDRAFQKKMRAALKANCLIGI